MRLALPLLLLLPIVLAGCIDAPADVDAAALPGALAPAPLAFDLPVALPDGGGGEPNIAALPDGTLFVTAPTGLQAYPNVAQGAAWLWRSQDGGATWETLREPAPVLGPFCSCDADVVTSPDGWVYYSDWSDANYLVERSGDGGDTWESTPVTTREAVGLAFVDRQWLVAGEDGFVGLFYAHFRPAAAPLPLTEFNSGVHAVFSHDHGATWSQPVVVVAREAGHSTQIAHPYLLSDGTLVMPYADVELDDGYWRDPGTVRMAVSRDHGETWEHVHVADAPEGFDNLWAVQAAVGRDDIIHVGWAARIDDERMGVYVATSRDVGATWSEPVLVRGEGLNFLPWLDAAEDGRVAIGWYGGDARGEPTEAKESDAWFAYVAQSEDAGETWSVQRVSEEPVKKGPMCPRGASCRGERELLDYVSLVYAPDGRLHYAYARSGGEELTTLVATTLAQLALDARAPGETP